MPRYLEQRRRRWYAVLDVPDDVRRRVGGSGRRVQSLGTESLTEAHTLVLPVIAAWKAEFEEVRTGKRSRVKEDLIARAVRWQQEYLAATDEDEKEGLHDLISDAAADIAPRGSGDKASRDEAKAIEFYRIATGESLPTAHHLDGWIAGLKDAPKTLDEKRRIVLAFAKVFAFTHQVDHASVRAWVRKMLTDEGVARGTIGKRVSFVRGYWEHLKLLGVVPAEERTFDGVLPKVTKKTKADKEDEREAFEPEDVCKLLKAAEAKKDFDLAALIWLAMWTGCRIEELCSLKIAEVRSDRIRVRDAKTKAGNREVPLHKQVRPLVGRLKEKSKDSYLLSGLTFNKYGDRSNAIGKRFGKLKTKHGFGEAHVFHSIRKTVVTLLENAEVPENVTADIVGHDKQSLTYGLYSDGSTFTKRAAAVAKLHYKNASEPSMAAESDQGPSPAVNRAVRRSAGAKGSQPVERSRTPKLRV